jgi:hypothetical protein
MGTNGKKKAPYGMNHMGLWGAMGSSLHVFPIFDVLELDLDWLSQCHILVSCNHGRATSVRGIDISPKRLRLICVRVDIRVIPVEDCTASHIDFNHVLFLPA